MAPLIEDNNLTIKVTLLTSHHDEINVDSLKTFSI